MRIIGTVFLEQSEDWSKDRVYFDMAEYLKNIGYTNKMNTHCSLLKKAESPEGEATGGCVCASAA